MTVVNTLGRRKTAVARVYLSKGTGKVTINKREASNYFKTPVLLEKINPFLNGMESRLKKRYLHSTIYLHKTKTLKGF